MARALRLEFDGAIYHITARGNRREQVFTNDADRARFLGIAADLLPRFAVELHAYVLLPNHFHLLVRTQRPNLSRWMHRLMVTYAIFFNRRHGKIGHLFQGRYKSLLVEEGNYLLELSRYLHLNPVRGRVIGLGNPEERRARLRAYLWSSYRGYAGLAKQQEFVSDDLVLGELGAGSGRDGRTRYRRFVEEGLLREIQNPVEAAQWQTALGSEDFLQRIRDKMEPQRPKRREVQALRRGTKGPDPRALIASIAEQHDLPVERLLKGKAYGLQARSIAMWVVWQLCEMSLREVGALFGGMDYAAVAQRLRRLERNHAIQKRLHRVLLKCQNI